MKKRLLSIMTLLMLVSCKGGNASVTSPKESNSVSSVNSNPSANVSSPKKEEEEFEKSDNSDLPYVSSISELKKEDWHDARWIWSEKNPADAYFAFRRTFELSKLPSKAELYISADSKVNVYLNGKLVILEANIKRGMTTHDSYYSVHDLLASLKTGKNVLAFEVCYFGQSSNSFVSAAQGGLLFDLDMGESHIVSDASTKVERIQAYRNKSQLKENYPGHPTSTFLAERDIYFDNRLKEEFYLPDFDESSFVASKVVGKPGCLPFGDLYLCDLPAFDFDSEVTWMNLKEGVLDQKLTQDTVFTFQLDSNQQFLPYFELESEEEGKVITFYTNSKTTQGVTSFMDDYVTSQGAQSYQQWYYRTGYQFIMEVPKGVTIKKVGYRKTGYHSTKVGNYQSDNSRLDLLWTKAYNTLNICMRDNYMDCPERERSPYTGDAANQIEETLYALDEDGWKLAKKTLLGLPGWVKADGIIPSRWPSATTNEIPMQNLAFLVTAYDYYLYTGDADTMKKVYPIFVNYLKLWNQNADGSIEYRNGSFPWVDWGSGYDSDLMEQGWYYWAMESVEELGKELSLLSSEEKSYFDGRMQAMKASFHGKYQTENGFASVDENGQRHDIDDRGNALAVLSGLADESDYEMVTNVLKSTMNSSPYMERFALEALCKMSKLSEAKERMLNRYQGMIDYEASTLWEAWSSKPIDGTINHGWAGGPLVVMSKYFAGIRPLGKGYESYEIKPSVVSSSYKSSVNTPKGILSYTLKKEESVTTIQVSAIDANGSLVLDSSYGDEVTLDGKKVNLENRTLSLTKGEHTIVIC